LQLSLLVVDLGSVNQESWGSSYLHPLQTSENLSSPGRSGSSPASKVVRDPGFFSFALPVAVFWAAIRSSLGMLKSTVISEGEFGIKCVRWVDFQALHSIPLDAKPNSAAVWKSFPKSGKVLPKVRQAV